MLNLFQAYLQSCDEHETLYKRYVKAEKQAKTPEEIKALSKLAKQVREAGERQENLAQYFFAYND